MGKSTSTQTATLTPEQREQIQAQTKLLTETLIPAYQETIGGAKEARDLTSELATGAYGNASGIAGTLQEQLGEQGSAAFDEGLSGISGLTAAQADAGFGQQQFGNDALTRLFSDEYKQSQLDASIQPLTEQIREQAGLQNAQFGGAGQSGSARSALAQANLADLSANRLAATKAGVSQGIEGQRQRAAEAILQAGLTNTAGAQAGSSKLTEAGAQALTGSQLAADKQINYSGLPQDIFNKYAPTVFGVPGGSGSNFAGTQGSTSKSKGFSLAQGGLLKDKNRKVV